MSVTPLIKRFRLFYSMTFLITKERIDHLSNKIGLSFNYHSSICRNLLSMNYQYRLNSILNEPSELMDEKEEVD